MNSMEGGDRRAIRDYEGLYEIDSEGAVYSLARTFERNARGRHQKVRVPARILARTYSRKGYPQVTLFRDGRGRTLQLHRLVCETFHGAPAEGQEVAHQNGDKRDPRAENLRWATRSENALDKWQHGTMVTGSASRSSKLRPDQAQAIYDRAHAGEGHSALAREFGVSEAAVRKIKSGRAWKSHIKVRALLTQSQEDCND